MNASAPNWPLTGSHSRLVRKSEPNWRIERVECDARAKIIEPTIKSSSNAAANINARKTASPALPVGDSRCRQFPANLGLLTPAPFGRGFRGGLSDAPPTHSFFLLTTSPQTG